MALKAVIFDLDGTLIDSAGRPVGGVREMMDDLMRLGIKIAVASNRGQGYVQARLAKSGLPAHLIVSNDLVGAKKPSPKFCLFAAEQLQINKNDMIYVGDNNLTDAICAINAGVLYLNAIWSNRNPKYGVKISTPNDVVRYIKAFLLREPQWYWSLNDIDASGHSISVKSLLPGYRSWDDRLGEATFNVLKRDEEVAIGDFAFSSFLLNYFLTTIYLSGLSDEAKVWCLIPPSRGQQHRRILGNYTERATKLFRSKYIGDLLLRHRPAVKAAYARRSTGDPGFLNQANTLQLNPDHIRNIEGKHVLVIDDYCTRGHSFECARQLLRRGGAEHVTCASIGRYGSRFFTQAPEDSITWDPWKPRLFAQDAFSAHVHYQPSNNDAVDPIIQSFDYLLGSA